MTMVTKVREWEFLVALCGHALGLLDQLSHSDIHDSSHINWASLINMAKYHKVRPLVYKAIHSLNIGHQVPSDALIELERISKHVLFRNLENTKELIRIKAILDNHDIPFIPYKGIILSHLAYSDLGIRESSDIDILFKLSDYDKLQSALNDEGYIEKFRVPKYLQSFYRSIICEQSFERFQFNGKRSFHIDAHWMVGPKMIQTHIDIKDLWGYYENMDLLGASLNVLSPEGLIITTCIHHGYSDGWNYMKNICDLAALIKTFESEINWAKIFGFCEEHKITNLVTSGLTITSRYFKFSVSSFQKHVDERTEDWCRKKMFYHQSDHRQKKDNFWMFYGRLAQNLSLRKYLSTKFKIIIYNVFYILIRPFIAKQQHKT